MANESTIELAALRFEGRRFEGHALDVECTQELIAYRSLILECAKELWRRKNPDRVRLPKGFEDGFRVQFDRIDEGSAVVPLRRVREAVQPELDLGDEFDEAAALVDAVIAAAARNDPLPDRFPAGLTPLLANLGRTLGDDEVLFTRARNSTVETACTPEARVRLRASGAFDDSAVPIWEQLARIGRDAPLGTWESVPDDLSTRIDEVVYGHGEGGR